MEVGTTLVSTFIIGMVLDHALRAHKMLTRALRPGIDVDLGVLGIAKITNVRGMIARSPRVYHPETDGSGPKALVCATNRCSGHRAGPIPYIVVRNYIRTEHSYSVDDTPHFTKWVK